jgi:hypothetical protein
MVAIVIGLIVAEFVLGVCENQRQYRRTSERVDNAATCRFSIQPIVAIDLKN